MPGDKTEFSLKDPLFNMDTYMGRFNSLLFKMNPLHAFYSKNTIRDMEKKIKAAH